MTGTDPKAEVQIPGHHAPKADNQPAFARGCYLESWAHPATAVKDETWHTPDYR